jgi:tetratricopeptide (TPR) repeat protein
MQSINRTDRFFFLCLLAGAFIVRLIYLYESRTNPFFDAPIVDARVFLEQAQHIAAGHLIGSDEPFWQPPLYIYCIAFICWLFPADYFVAIRLFQIVLGVLSCALVYLIALRTFSSPTARLAAIAAALCGTSIYFEGELLAVPLEIALNLFLVYRLLLARATDDKYHWIIAGLLAGLAALTRPNVLLFIAVFVLWQLFAKSNRSQEVRSRLIAPALLLASTALVILPVTIRNYTLEPDPVLISSNGGINFYIGNSGHYDEKVAIHPGMRWEEMAMEPVRLGHKTAAAKSAYFFKRSLAYIAQHPLDYAATLAKKTYLFWSGPELKRNQDIYYARHFSSLLSILLWDHMVSMPFGLVGPLALMGLFFSWQRKDDGITLLRLYAFSYTVSVLLFFAVARYRMPILPIFILFAAEASLALYHRLRQRPFTENIAALSSLAILSVWLNWPAAPNGELDPQLHFDLGEVYLRKSQYDKAEQHAKRALELEPDYNYARHNLAVAYFHQNQYQRCIEQGLRTLRENPHRPDTHLLLGRAFSAIGDLRTARMHLRTALDIDPHDGMTHYYYGRVLYKIGDYANAIIHLQRAVEWTPNDPWIHYELGRALHAQGDAAAALRSYKQAWALKHLPTAANAIGAIYFVAGDYLSAQQFFAYALEQDPNNLEAQINMGLLEIEQGNRAAGLDRLRNAQRQFPQSDAVRNALRAISSSSLPSPTKD